MKLLFWDLNSLIVIVWIWQIVIGLEVTSDYDSCQIFFIRLNRCLCITINFTIYINSWDSHFLHRICYNIHYNNFCHSLNQNGRTKMHLNGWKILLVQTMTLMVDQGLIDWCLLILHIRVYVVWWLYNLVLLVLFTFSFYVLNILFC